MNFGGIFGALIGAAILAAVVWGIEKYLMPFIDPYLPKSLSKYTYIVVGLGLVLIAGMIKLGTFGKYIVDAGQVFMVLGFVEVYSNLIKG